MAFAAAVFGNIVLIFLNRSRITTLGDLVRPSNPTLWWLVAGALGGLLLALYVVPLREIFRFGPLSPAQLLLSFATGAAGLAALGAWRTLAKGFIGGRAS